MRTKLPSITELLFGNTRGRILTLLFDRPQEAFFIRQIARSVAVSVGTVQRELTALAEAGVILRTQSGNQVYYRANREHPAFAEMQALLAKTSGMFNKLAEALKPLEQNIQFAFVYGSFARREETSNSDIDLMVIGAVTLDDLLEHLAPLERTLGRTINPTVYSDQELSTKLQAGNHFLSAIQKGTNTFLIGDANKFNEFMAALENSHHVHARDNEHRHCQRTPFAPASA